jgi:hypothetical protein
MTIYSEERLHGGWIDWGKRTLRIHVQQLDLQRTAPVSPVRKNLAARAVLLTKDALFKTIECPYSEQKRLHTFLQSKI